MGLGSQLITLRTVCSGALQDLLWTIIMTLIYTLLNLVSAKKSEYIHFTCHYTELMNFNHYFDLFKKLCKNDDWSSLSPGPLCGFRARPRTSPEGSSILFFTHHVSCIIEIKQQEHM